MELSKNWNILMIQINAQFVALFLKDELEAARCRFKSPLMHHAATAWADHSKFCVASCECIVRARDGELYFKFECGGVLPIERESDAVASSSSGSFVGLGSSVIHMALNVND